MAQVARLTFRVVVGRDFWLGRACYDGALTQPFSLIKTPNAYNPRQAHTVGSHVQPGLPSQTSILASPSHLIHQVVAPENVS